MIKNDLFPAYIKGIRFTIICYIIIILLLVFANAIDDRGYGAYLFIFAIGMLSFSIGTYNIGAGDKLFMLKYRGFSVLAIVSPAVLVIVLSIRLFKDVLKLSDFLTTIYLFIPMLVISLFYVHFGYISKKRYTSLEKVE